MQLHTASKYIVHDLYAAMDICYDVTELNLQGSSVTDVEIVSLWHSQGPCIFAETEIPNL